MISEGKSFLPLCLPLNDDLSYKSGEAVRREAVLQPHLYFPLLPSLLMTYLKENLLVTDSDHDFPSARRRLCYRQCHSVASLSGRSIV